MFFYIHWRDFYGSSVITISCAYRWDPTLRWSDTWRGRSRSRSPSGWSCCRRTSTSRTSLCSTGRRTGTTWCRWHRPRWTDPAEPTWSFRYCRRRYSSGTCYRYLHRRCVGKKIIQFNYFIYLYFSAIRGKKSK